MDDDRERGYTHRPVYLHTSTPSQLHTYDKDVDERRSLLVLKNRLKIQ